MCTATTARACSCPPCLVVGLDPDRQGSAALDWALSTAGSYRGRVLVVTARCRRTAAEPRRRTEQAQRLVVAQSLARHHGARPTLETRLVDGEPATALLEASAGAQMLVLGCDPAHGPGSAPLGRLTDTCLRHAACPVVLVPEVVTA